MKLMTRAVYHETARIGPLCDDLGSYSDPGHCVTTPNPFIYQLQNVIQLGAFY